MSQAGVGRQYQPVYPDYETVEDNGKGKDSVAVWLALGCGFVFGQQGKMLFEWGVPARRWMTRPAETRQVFVDAEVSEAVWVSPLVDGAGDETSESMDTEVREVSPAQYNYEAPRPFIGLYASVARWAYETFHAAEFDSMFRLCESAWPEYVRKLQEEMERR